MIATYRRRRWGDNDHILGPFTYARDDQGYRPLAIALKSGDEERPDEASLRFSGFGHTFIVALPGWLIRPWRYKVGADWDAATQARLGRNWFWMIYPREFGFSLSDNLLTVHYGRQTMNSSTENMWLWRLPWANWRMVRHSFYGLNCEHVADAPRDWKEFTKVKADVPVVVFTFEDFDGEEIQATTLIERREWHLGEGWFKWLGALSPTKVRWSLDIDFSAETGRKKGSWKGGTLGTGIEMAPGELHIDAFRRYCEKNEMTFIS